MPSPLSSPHIPPSRQAGGGATSDAASTQRIPSFNPVVLSYLEEAFKALCCDSSHGSHHGLDQASALHFLTRSQGEDIADAGNYFAEAVNGLSSFLSYMSSSTANAMAPPKNRDLSHPMSDYYISSSHNTYLTGNQLYSEASAASYKNVLLRGCRCLEIDVWDGGSNSSSSASSFIAEDDGGKQPHSVRRTEPSPNMAAQSHTFEQRASSAFDSSTNRCPVNPETATAAAPAPWRLASADERPEPRVLHGYTLTKDVSFRAVCNAIRESAFVATDLPVIVSLEVHASLEQQAVMVDIIREAWKGMLVDISESSEEQIDQLPSPDQLRRKILIKVKWAPASPGQESNDPLDQGTPASSCDDENGPGQKKGKKGSKILQGLSQLGVYTRGYTFKHFNQPEASIPSHVFSLSEAKVVDMSKSNGHELFSHNRNYLMRAYPSGMRVDSSNLEPLFLWSQGVQIAALNWQKWDKGMMLNEGMFAGEEGWVLKPEGYRAGDQDTIAGDSVRKHTLHLTIELCAGQNLPLPPDEKVAKKFHPYVKCELLCGDGKTKSEQSTKKHEKYKWVSKSSKGTDPDYYSEAYHFSSVPDVVEELSFVRVKVKDNNLGKDSLAAWACIKLSRLKSGYRFIRLLDARGMECSGVLLVRIVKVLVS